MANEPAPKQVNVQLKYEDLTARYASQVALAVGQEEVFLEFSSGLMPNQGTGTSTMPVHTRIAMTANGLRRLYDAIGQLFAKAQKPKPGTTVATEQPKS